MIILAWLLNLLGPKKEKKGVGVGKTGHSKHNQAVLFNRILKNNSSNQLLEENMHQKTDK